MRTYERGVEAETLACGTGSVASAALIEAWGLGGPRTSLLPKSGRALTATIRRQHGAIAPSLMGEGRVVFEGRLREV